MIRFKYKARDENGNLFEGEDEADSRSDIAKKLLAKNLVPTEIENSGVFLDSSRSINIYRNIKSTDLTVFFRQLSAIMQSGVPLLESLSTVFLDTSNNFLKEVIFDVKNRIEGGETFSQALSHYPKIFPKKIIAMVEAGEKGGVLDSSLKKIASSLEKETKIRSKIMSSLRYPFFVISALVIAFIVVMTFIIPKFSALFSSFGENLPLPTRILMFSSQFIIKYWIFVLGAVLLSFYLFKKLSSLPNFKIRIDNLVIHLPILGNLYKKIVLGRIFDTLADLLDSGVTLTVALELASSTTNNLILSRAVFEVGQKVSAGNSLTNSMRSSNVFPVVAINLVALGEKSGDLSQMFYKIASYFDEETDYILSNLMSFIEPILILILGSFVLLVALGVFLPMWDVMGLYFR